MLRVGQTVPEFELLRYPELTRLSSRNLLDGGPVGLLFAKESCPTCRWAFPYLDRIHTRNPDLPPDRIFLVLQENPETARRVVDQYGLTTPILLDVEPWRTSESFAINFVPDGFLLGGDGKIEVSFESFERNGLEEIAARLRAAQRLKPVPLFAAAEGVAAFRPG
jgi:peroxiredoxin